MNKNTLYITTPIFYVNDAPHIGHCYTNLLTDSISRLYSLLQIDVRAQTGTDEHGQKVMKSAIKKNQNTMEFCNFFSEKFRELAVQLNFSSSYPEFNYHDKFNQYKEALKLYKDEDESLFNYNKNFIRTTEGRNEEGKITEESLQKGRHIKFAQQFWSILEKNGWIYKDKYCGWYSIRDEAFYADSELIDGKAPTGTEVEWQEEESYFFRLSEFQDFLLQLYIHGGLITPNFRAAEVMSFVSGTTQSENKEGKFKKGALKDLCLSRINLEWGIPVPNDQKHSIYVWLDALTNYMSAIDYKFNQDNTLWENADVVHVIGKDILRFHAIYWPAFIIATIFTYEEWEKIEKNKEFILSIRKHLPTSIVVHGWWTNKGEKISKSLGNTIVPSEEIEYLESFGLKQEIALDYFRYFLLKTMSIGKDSDYNRDNLQNIINGDLANNIGNLFNRTISMIQKYELMEDLLKGDIDFKEEVEFLDSIVNNKNQHIYNLLEELAIEKNVMKIIEIAMHISSMANVFIDKNEPWKLHKTDINKTKRVLFASYLATILSLLLLRFVIPNIIENVFDYIKLDNKKRILPTKELWETENYNKLIEYYKPSSDFINKTESPIFLPRIK